MRLWEEDVVDSISKTPEFLEALEKSKKRKESAKKAVATKVNNLMQEVEKAISAIHVEVISYKEVISRTIDAKIEWYKFHEIGDNHDVYSADDLVKQRWAVNYIRHNLTVYDDVLYQLSKKPGQAEAYKKYKNSNTS